MAKRIGGRSLLVMAAVFMLSLVLMVTGCGKKEEGKTDEEEQVVTEETRQGFDVETGQHFNLTLESNPTTGYGWQTAAAPDEKIVRVLASDYIAPQGDLVGAPGEQVWHFWAVGEGSTTMVLEYARPWEAETPPAKRLSVDLKVKQADNEVVHAFRVEVGRTFDLTLDTNPSAGYSWTLTREPDAGVLKLVSNEVSGGGDLGAPQRQVWRFEGLGAGKTSFELSYKGPGAGDPVERKDIVEVTVSAPPPPAPTPPKTYDDPTLPISAERGEVFILQVKSSGGAGYEWRLAGDIKTDMLKFMGSESKASELIGGEVVTEFTFTVLGPGQQDIRLGLYGPSGDEPSREVAFKVTTR